MFMFCLIMNSYVWFSNFMLFSLLALLYSYYNNLKLYSTPDFCQALGNYLIFK